MIPTILTPPAHYSADVAYRALSPLRPFIDSALPLLISGLTAKTARQLFAQLGRIATNAQQAYESGALDGSAEWKALVGGALQDIAAIAAVAQPIEQRYSQQTGNVIATSAAGGTVLSLEQAAEQVVFDQTDIDAIVAVIASVIEA